MSNIADIVDVTVEIEAPVASSESFSDLLLIIPPATTAGEITLSGVARIASLRDLVSYGYTVDDHAYKAVGIAFSQNPGISHVYVTPRLVETVEPETPGEDPTLEPENIATTLDRAVDLVAFYGFAIVGTETTALDIAGAAQWAEANSKLFGFTWLGEELPANINSYDHTFALYAGDTGSAETEFYGEIAMMAKCFSYAPGSETWALKTLNGIDGSALTASKKSALQNMSSNYYYPVAHKNITNEGKVGSGEFIDVIRFKDWLLNEIQINEYNYLTSRPKIPYNDDGITGVQNVLEGVLSGAQRTGGIDVDRFDDDGVLYPGYTVTVPRASTISSADRKNRVLRGVTFTARLAGAIHMLYIRGYLVY